MSCSQYGIKLLLFTLTTHFIYLKLIGLSYIFEAIRNKNLDHNTFYIQLSNYLFLSLDL